MDRFWDKLLQELSIIPRVIKKDSGDFASTSDKDVPLFHYPALMNQRVSNFIGECRTKITDSGQVPAEFDDLLFKLEELFSSQFGTSFPTEKITYPLYFNKKNIPEENPDNDPFVFIIKARINVFSMSINFLRKQLNGFGNNNIDKSSRSRRKADIRDFRSRLSADQLKELYKVGKRMNFIGRETDLKDFIDIFQGKKASGGIYWQGSIYALNKFINGINGEAIDKLTDGKWEVVSQLFYKAKEEMTATEEAKKIRASSLLRPSEGKNDRLNDLDIFISSFNEPI